MAVLKRSKAGDFLEKAIEGLVRREAAQRNSMGECLMVIGVLRIDKDSLRVLHAITGDVLRKTESRSAVDAVGYIGAVTADCVGKVLNSQIHLPSEP